MNLVERKARLRSRIWGEMEVKGNCEIPLPVVGRIPNFEGAEEAASKATTGGMEESKGYSSNLIARNGRYASWRSNKARLSSQLRRASNTATL